MYSICGTKIPCRVVNIRRETLNWSLVEGNHWQKYYKPYSRLSLSAVRGYRVCLLSLRGFAEDHPLRSRFLSSNYNVLQLIYLLGSLERNPHNHTIAMPCCQIPVGLSCRPYSDHPIPSSVSGNPEPFHVSWGWETNEISLALFMSYLLCKYQASASNFFLSAYSLICPFQLTS